MLKSSSLLRQLALSALFVSSSLVLLPHCGSDPAVVAPGTDEHPPVGGAGGADATGGRGLAPNVPPVVIPEGGDGNEPVPCRGDDCEEPVDRPCGNGQLDDGEECDDGN